jgi:hypothetical protein
MCNSISTLSLAYYFTGNKQYSKKAVSILRTWFLNPKTRMNPNLNYSQIAPGHFEDKGRQPGLIDTYSFISMIDAISLLDNSGKISKKDYKQLQEWFAQLSQWMITAENGIKESNATNNHSIAYDAQVAFFSKFAGMDSLTLKIINDFPTRRLAVQINPDGSQPRELTRTIAFHYTVYNIVHMMDMCDLASRLGADLYDSCDGAIDKTFQWVIPFLGKPETFPYKQINDWRTVETSFAQQLYRASVYSKNEDYKKLYYQFKAEPEDLIFTLLYL